MKLIVLLASAACVFAQQTPPPISTVRAHGTATVTAKPDQVRIEVGVITRAQTAQAASAANAKQLTDVLAELKRAAGADAQIQTSSYSVNPEYKYPREGGAPQISGYVASNTVRVTTSDVAGAGKIIDAATRTGANTVQGVHFGLKDEQATRAQALSEAATAARANAEAMATALNQRVVRIVGVDDSGPVSVQPVREMMMARAAVADAPPTPVEPGEIRVVATVTVTLEIAAK